MHIKVFLKYPFDNVFGFKNLDLEVPADSTVQDIVDCLVVRFGVLQPLNEKRLMSGSVLHAIYVLNKHLNGGTVITGERVLEESDTLSLFGTFIGG